jgi:hypothetical protein
VLALALALALESGTLAPLRVHQPSVTTIATQASFESAFDETARA